MEAQAEAGAASGLEHGTALLGVNAPGLAEGVDPAGVRGAAGEHLAADELDVVVRPAGELVGNDVGTEERRLGVIIPATPSRRCSRVDRQAVAGLDLDGRRPRALGLGVQGGRLDTQLVGARPAGGRHGDADAARPSTAARPCGRRTRRSGRRRRRDGCGCRRTRASRSARRRRQRRRPPAAVPCRRPPRRRPRRRPRRPPALRWDRCRAWRRSSTAGRCRARPSPLIAADRLPRRRDRPNRGTATSISWCPPRRTTWRPAITTSRTSTAVAANTTAPSGMTIAGAGQARAVPSRPSRSRPGAPARTRPPLAQPRLR